MHYPAHAVEILQGEDQEEKQAFLALTEKVVTIQNDPRRKTTQVGGYLRIPPKAA